MALVFSRLDLNNRPIQILDEPQVRLRGHDVALIQAVFPVLIDQNHFHQNLVFAVLVVHLNIAVLQAVLNVAMLPQQNQQQDSNQNQQYDQQADPAQGDKGAYRRLSAADDAGSFIRIGHTGFRGFRDFDSFPLSQKDHGIIDLICRAGFVGACTIEPALEDPFY